MTTDMVSWLRQQILARKAAAKDLDGAVWGVLERMMERPDGGGDEQVMLFDVVDDEELFTITIGATAANEDHFRHMALNDPQDTLARCETELAILDEHGPETIRASWGAEDTVCKTCRYDDGLNTYPYGHCPTVHKLAYGYRHRPGWLPEWAPGDVPPGDGPPQGDQGTLPPCCACGCANGGCEGGPECLDPDEGFPLCRRFYSDD